MKQVVQIVKKWRGWTSFFKKKSYWNSYLILLLLFVQEIVSRFQILNCSIRLHLHIFISSFYFTFYPLAHLYNLYVWLWCEDEIIPWLWTLFSFFSLLVIFFLKEPLYSASMDIGNWFLLRKKIVWFENHYCMIKIIQAHLNFNIYQPTWQAQVFQSQIRTKLQLIIVEIEIYNWKSHFWRVFLFRLNVF